MGWSVTGMGPVKGCCEHGDEPARPIKGEEFLDYLGVLTALKDSHSWG